METLAIIMILIVALEHYYILILEMFLGNTKRAAKAFDIEYDFLQDKRVQVMFANQGLYNGFLASGLIYGLLFFNNDIRFVGFFLVCVIVAGIYGALTVSKRILVVQAFPALIALILCIGWY